MYLQPRQSDYDECYQDVYGRTRCYRSAWDSWVRWVVLAVVVVFFFLLFVCCSCITARRRRKAGRQPFYGTGWAARPGQNTQQPYYGHNANPAPPYSAQPNQNNGGYYGNNATSGGYNHNSGANQGYYGGQQNGIDLQSPQPAYGGGNVYQPPPGPPPGKDGIIR